MVRPRTLKTPFCRFNSSPVVIRLAVMMYVRFPYFLRDEEDLLFERVVDISHQTVRTWWNRFGPMFAAKLRRKCSSQMRQVTQWRWHPDEVYVIINGELRHL